MNKYLDAMAKPFMPITPWLLRLGLGIAFIYHGIGKFPLPPERMVTWFESMGFMYPEIVTSLVARFAPHCSYCVGHSEETTAQGLVKPWLDLFASRRASGE